MSPKGIKSEDKLQNTIWKALLKTHVFCKTQQNINKLFINNVTINCGENLFCLKFWLKVEPNIDWNIEFNYSILSHLLCLQNYSSDSHTNRVTVISFKIFHLFLNKTSNQTKTFIKYQNMGSIVVSFRLKIQTIESFHRISSKKYWNQNKSQTFISKENKKQLFSKTTASVALERSRPPIWAHSGVS